MHALLPQKAALRHVTLRGARHDSQRARHVLEQALAPVDWAPAGLPPRAVLLVRRLAPAARREGGVAVPLARRVAAALDECAGKARRPWLGEDAGAADAVVFTDEAEMAACLVRDWLDGVAAGRWWWRSVLEGAEAAAWLYRRVLVHGELLVPVAARLIEGAGASARAAALLESWFVRLGEMQAQEAVASVERAFALASLPAAVPAPVVRRGPAGVYAAVAPAEPAAPLEREEADALERLVSTVPELRDGTLPEPQRRLLALVLVVVRSPCWARTPQFARALSRINLVEPQGGAGEDTAASHAGRVQAAPARGGAPGGVALPADSAPPAPARVLPGGQPAAQAKPGDGAGGPDISFLPAGAWQGESAAPAGALPARDAAPVSAAERLAAVHAAEARMAAACAPARVVAPVPRDVQTGFGGIFYLLNAALALGLYGDFTMPRAQGLALSPWDWLALIGRAWFGAPFVKDPVWPLLAALAGRPAGRAPGRDFQAPAAWAMDPAWLLPWGPVHGLQVHATRSRLCVSHPAGFLVFDVPRDPLREPLAQARALCAPHEALRGASLLTSPLKGRALPRPGTARWLRWMLGYLDARLALTLGAETPEEVPALVGRHAARISTSASEVDVVLQLADLPLSIRIAGLDRDPGWIPAAGRGLRFRFV